MQGAGAIQQFNNGRALLAKAGYARNVRLADIVAVASSAVTGTIAAGTPIEGTYTGAGSYAGPLDSNGNMPESAGGVIIGAALCLPKRWVATEEDENEQMYQQVAQDTSLIVKVAGTDVLALHATMAARFASLQGGGIYTGPLWGIPGPAEGAKFEDVPSLLVKPGERVEQRLQVRRGIALSSVTVTPEFTVRMVVADKGQDR